MADIIFLLLVSTVTPPVATVGPDALHGSGSSQPMKINILAKQPEPECPEQTTDEIVVCGKKTDQERYRLRRTSDDNLYKEDPNEAEFSISENTKIAAENEAAQIGPGIQSNRIMARIKFKF